MKVSEVTMVRVYLHEAESGLQELVKYLHDESGVRGLTVFRGISGFGQSSELHTSKILELSLDLPVVVEFFDVPGKVEEILQNLESKVRPGHLAFWRANINEQSGQR